MKHVSVLIPEGHFSLVNVEGTFQILTWVNGLLEEAGKPPLFQVQLVGLSRPANQATGMFTIHPDVMISEVAKTDLLILPAVHGPIDMVISRNEPLLKWVKEQYTKGSEIASFCIGAFMLASTGLLNGKPCATHWHYADEFRKRFPEANLQDDRIITDAEGIYTSGGAFSFTNLLIYLVEKHAGREMAIRAAKVFMIDIDRNSQSPFMVFSGQKEHDDKEVLQAQKFIEQHFSGKITVENLAERFRVGRRTFERRFKKATANTVTEYIQRVRVEAAKKQLESGRSNVNEVMYEVGYSDTKAFRDVFKKITGMSPVAYRYKYNRHLAAA